MKSEKTQPLSRSTLKRFVRIYNEGAIRKGFVGRSIGDIYEKLVELRMVPRSGDVEGWLEETTNAWGVPTSPSLDPVDNAGAARVGVCVPGVHLIDEVEGPQIRVVS